MKAKRRQSQYPPFGMAPVEEEHYSDSTKTKLFASRASKALKMRYANTYQLEPHNRFRDCLVRGKAQAILKV